MQIVLLPGLDGTGKLFEEFVNKLAVNHKVTIVSYPAMIKGSYSDYVAYVKEHLPKDDFIVVAESFSGNIAHLLVQEEISNLKAVVFVATFLQNPRALLLNRYTLKLLKPLLYLPLNTTIVRFLLLGSKADTEVLKKVTKTIKTLPPSTILHRLALISNLKCKSVKIDTKAVVLIAKDDKLIPQKCIKDFEKSYKNIPIFKLNGAHLLLQTNITETLNIIEHFIKETKCE